MKDLTALNGNIVYKKENGKYVPVLELIVIVSEPKFVLTNTHDLVKTREVEEFRFLIKEVDKFAANILRLKEDLLKIEAEENSELPL